MEQQSDNVAHKNGSSFPNDQLGGNDDEDGDGDGDEDEENLSKPTNGLSTNVQTAGKYDTYLPVLY